MRLLRVLLWLFIIFGLAWMIGSFNPFSGDAGNSVVTLVMAAIGWFLMMLVYSAWLAVWGKILDIVQKQKYISQSKLWSDKAFMAAIFFVCAIAVGTYRELFTYDKYFYVLAFVVYSLVYTGRRSYLFKIPKKDTDIYSR